MPNKKPNIILLVTDDTGLWRSWPLRRRARGAACTPHILIGWQLKG